jgi:hypothetical protein
MSILLTGVNESLQVVLDAAPATNQLPATASYADQGGLGGDNTINTNGTTAVTVVAAPAAGVARVINGIAIPNRDTATRIVTVNKVVSGTPFQIVKVTLLTGYQLYYENTGGWRVLDASGNFAEIVQSVQSGAWTVAVNNFPATQPISGAVSQTGGPWTFNLTQMNSVALGSPSNYGTSPGAVAVQGVNAFVTNPVAVTGTFFQATQPVSGTVAATQSGTWTVTTSPPSNASTNIAQYGGSATSLGSKVSASSVPVVIASDQAAIPVTGTVSVSPPANATTNITQFGGVAVSTGTGASGTGIPRVTVSNDSNVLSTQSGTWTVQPGNTANTTPWLVADAGLNLSQGSTTSGEKGPLVQAAAVSTSPTLTALTTNPLTSDLKGSLRVNHFSGSGKGIGGVILTNTTATGITTGTLNLYSLRISFFGVSLSVAGILQVSLFNNGVNFANLQIPVTTVAQNLINVIELDELWIGLTGIFAAQLSATPLTGSVMILATVSTP